MNAMILRALFVKGWRVQGNLCRVCEEDCKMSYWPVLNKNQARFQLKMAVQLNIISRMLNRLHPDPNPDDDGNKSNWNDMKKYPTYSC